MRHQLSSTHRVARAAHFVADALDGCMYVINLFYHPAVNGAQLPWKKYQGYKNKYPALVSGHWFIVIDVLLLLKKKNAKLIWTESRMNRTLKFLEPSISNIHFTPPRKPWDLAAQ